MALISKTDAFLKFQKYGRNSSHFVWFLADLKFFECKNGWVFAYLQRKKVTLIALEPLIPFSGTLPQIDEHEFLRAWNDFIEEIKPAISFFVSVYDPFLAVLKKHGFQSIQVGKEPYVDLTSFMPTGNAGKGVRAARNQAVRAGVVIEEWTKEKIDAHPAMKREMALILRKWTDRNFLELGGFLNRVDPFQFMENRRYFLAINKKNRLEGFQVATPIPGENSFFLEDLILRPGASRGCGEFLTLEAMAGLANHKTTFASLGVVSLTSINEDSFYQLPTIVQLVLVKAPKYLSKIYNVKGLETFRKRFKPSRWENVHLVMKNHPDSGVSDTWAWFFALFTLIHSFEPVLKISKDWFATSFVHPIFKSKMAALICGLFTISYLGLNHGAQLPKRILDRFGFSGDSPSLEWPFRSILSDFLFFDFAHYLSSALILFFLIRWMEKTHKFKFVALCVVCTSLFDDFVNQFVLILPYSYFQPRIFQHLVSFKDVGPSLWMATFLGIQLCTVKKNREIIFSLLAIGCIMSFALNSTRLVTLVLNLNHTLFFIFGFIIGKLKFESDRKMSRLVANNKTPDVEDFEAEPKPRANSWSFKNIKKKMVSRPWS